MQRHLYRIRVTLATLALVGMLPALGATTATAPPPVLRPGDLDPSFGTGGKVLTNFGDDDVEDVAYAVALQPDGRIVAAGQSDANGNYNFALARYNGNGSLDAAFGTGGKVLTGFADSSAEANALALQPNGQIVVAGGSAPTNSKKQFALARYNVNGSLDTAFGTGGKVLTDFGGSDATDVAAAVALQPDGRIVAAGLSDANGKDYFALARYNGNGSLDTSFGTGGKVLTGFADGDAYANALAVQPDGRIVAAGGSIGFALARYSGNGTLDTSFGTGGRVETNFLDFGGLASAAYAVALQPDGRIVAAGGFADSTGKRQFALARYNGNGSLDTSFGTGGKVLTGYADSSVDVKALALQPDGRIVAAGGYYPINGDEQFALARYNVNGSLDTSFGTGGKVLTGFGSNGGIDVASAVALQSDGQIVAAGGFADANGSTYFALARYQGR